MKTPGKRKVCDLSVSGHLGSEHWKHSVRRAKLLALHAGQAQSPANASTAHQYFSQSPSFNAKRKCPVQSSAIITTSQEMLWAHAGRQIIAKILPWQTCQEACAPGLDSKVRRSPKGSCSLRT